MMVLLTTPSAVVLSVWMGVTGCFHPISVNVRRIGTSSFAVTQRAPSSASAADDMTNLMICAIVRTGPFHFGSSTFSDKKMCAPVCDLLIHCSIWRRSVLKGSCR